MGKQTEFKTNKGTILPLIDLKGKSYLQVAHRLVWFREEHPDWGITTQMIEHDHQAKMAIFKATITNESGHVMAQGTKVEEAKHFSDYVEKAETGSIGRALAMCGYGTQFAPEFDEGERLADAPQQPLRSSGNGTNYTRQQVAALAAQCGVKPQDIPADLAEVGVLPGPLPSNQWTPEQIGRAVRHYTEAANV